MFQFCQGQFHAPSENVNAGGEMKVHKGFYLTIVTKLQLCSGPDSGSFAHKVAEDSVPTTCLRSSSPVAQTDLHDLGP